jgi:hypothetical protein
VPTLTKARAAALHRAPGFAAAVDGAVYAQPLALPGRDGGRALLLVATERNAVHALDAGTGAKVWQVSLGAPVPLRSLPCGNIDPLGVTGTPVLDAEARTLYVAAMTTPDGGKTKRHRVFALSADDGSIRPGWPVDVQGLSGPGGARFDSAVQNQRGALALAGGRLHVPYGGHYGDCGDYRGWLVGIDTARPADVKAWVTGARGGGMWAPSGVARDGSSLYVATGNTFDAATWLGGEAVLRFSPGPAFGGTAADYFAPRDWQALDEGDVDLGGTGPVLLDLPGATPSRLAFALGKNGTMYVLDRERLGGIGGAVSSARVSSTPIINAAAAWVAPGGGRVAFRGSGVGCPAGQSGDLTAVALDPGAPPALRVLWCARQGGRGSPIVTVTAATGPAEAIVWSVGAEGDGRLRGFDGETGAVVFGGGGPAEALGTVRRFSTPAVTADRIYVASDGAVNAFAW